MVRCEKVTVSDEDDLEYVCVKITGEKKNCFIYAVYIPPNSTSVTYQKHIDAIDRIKMSNIDNLIVVGDANAPNIAWNKSDNCLNTFCPSGNLNGNIRDFIHYFPSKNLFQLVERKNCAGNVLDLCDTNEPELARIVYPEKPLSRPANPFHVHFELLFELNNCDKKEQKFRYDLSYDRADLDQMICLLGEIDVDSLVLAENINIAFDNFFQSMELIMSRCVPKIRKNISNCLPWERNRELKNLKNRIRKLKKRRKLSDSPTLINDYYQLCQQYDELYAEIFGRYIENLQLRFKEDPKRFWSYVDSKKSSNGLPSKMKWNDSEATTDGEKAELFAKFFDSVFVNDVSVSFGENFFEECLLDDSDIAITIDDVLKAMNDMDVRKSSGPDIISPVIYKRCAKEMAPILHALFSKSLHDGIFPDRLKLVFVKPIFKNGDKSTIENYRNVSLATTTSKLFEKIMLNKWNEKIYSQISTKQHGFVNGRSTTTNIMLLVSDIMDNFLDNAPTHIIFTDFQKAFDSFNHVLLVQKFAKFGFDKRAVKWIWSFLINRKNRVKIDESLSQDFSPVSGVPAGCILSAPLFLIFINDITECLKNVNLLMYADDLKIYKKVKSCDDYNEMKLAINNIRHWCNRNRLYTHL